MTSTSDPHRRSTIDDVARRAGISTATVSRFINGTALVSDLTAAKIQSAIQDLHYIPHSAAQVLASKKTNTIGLLLTNISGAFFVPLIRGVEERVVQGGYSLLVHSTESPAASRSKQLLAEHNTDGLLVFAASLDEAELRRLTEIHFPVVLLHHSPPPGLAIPYVTVENMRGVREMVQHLAAVHGRRRIVHIRGPVDHEDARWRERGYRQALEDCGLPFDPRLVIDGDFSTATARRAMAHLVQAAVPFDAVFAADDESASGAMMALYEAGFRIPYDVAVVGFDDLYLAEHLTPPLTTVRSPIEEVAYEGTGLLLRIINGERVPPETLLPTQIVIRRSCGCL